MPGQVIGEILLSQNADVKVIAFAQRAIDRSLYLHKFVWQNLEYVKEHPLFTLSERERQGLSHYYQLLMSKTQDGEGSFQHDVVRLLFQALILEFQMFVDRRRGETAESDSMPMEKDSSVRQSTLVYRRFMALLAESNVDLIHETTAGTIRQQLRYSNKTVKEICTELDFPNLSFFGKFVKEHLGMSPTEYRQQNLNHECRLHPDQGIEL